MTDTPAENGTAQQETGHPTAVDRLLAEARAEYRRVTPEQADELRRSGGLLIDIRPHANRAAEGEIPGAIPVERIVLEWRLDPASPYRLPQLAPDRPVVIFCNEGYSSSLAPPATPSASACRTPPT